MTTTDRRTSARPGGPEARPHDSAPERRIVISDPVAVRALAHKARIDALDELYASGASRTATELAERSNLTPSAMSYHLRALERFGLVERSPSEGDARERRWRATGDQLVVQPHGGSPVGMTAYVDLQIAQHRERLSDEIAYRHERRAAGDTRPTVPFMYFGAFFLDEETESEFLKRLESLYDEFESRSNKAQLKADEGRRGYYLMSALPDRSGDPQP